MSIGWQGIDFAKIRSDIGGDEFFSKSGFHAVALNWAGERNLGLFGGSIQLNFFSNSDLDELNF